MLVHKSNLHLSAYSMKCNETLFLGTTMAGNGHSNAYECVEWEKL